MSQTASKDENSSYGTILKSSSIIGGSQSVNYIVGLLRTKIVAILLGPAGVGLIGIYNSVIALSFTVTGMGLGNSGVREISAAKGQEDSEQIGEVQLALRRLALLLGAGGFILLALASPLVSEWLFQEKKYALPISLIGVILIFNGLKSTQIASIQGFRKIGDLAKSTILGTLISTAIAITFYATLGEQGIVPALVAMSLVAMFVTLRYAKPLRIRPKDHSWKTSFTHSKRLLLLGAAISWGALLGEISPFIARTLVVRDLGVEANGYYVAAWAISGLFIKFLLSAMWADFFPRLASVADAEEDRNRLINEQTEIGIIVALPGVLAMTVLSPVIIRILYSAEFAPAAALLPWFVLGLLGRITAWPMGMIVLARGEATVQAVMQTISACMHVGWLYFMFNQFSLVGLAMAFALHYAIYNFLLHLFLNKRYQFEWSDAVRRLLLVALLSLLFAATMKLLLPFTYYVFSCLLLLLVVSAFCVLQLYSRIANSPRLKKMVERMPNKLQSHLDSLTKRYG